MQSPSMGHRLIGDADRNAGCIGMDLHPQFRRGCATANSHFGVGVAAILETVQNGACTKADPLDDGQKYGGSCESVKPTKAPRELASV